MDLRRLRYFVVAAEELNFSRAAGRLRIAQPPLSAQIKQLENELGVLLFDRTGRGVRLTDAGYVLLEEARRIFIQLEQTARMVERVGSGQVGRLSLGFVPSATNEVLPPVLYEFQKSFPEVELFLHEMMPDQVVQRLHGKQIDVGFFYLPFDDSALDTRPVSREPLVVALPETHPLATEPEIDLRSLEREPFVLPRRYNMPGLYGQVTEVCRQAGFTPRPVQKDVWLMQTIVGLVASGIGVGLVPCSLRNFRRKGVVYKTVRGLSPTVEMGAIWRRSDSSAVLSAFLSIVGEVAQLAEGKRESGRSVALRTAET
ncbi:MAG TPA: LysR family transcriptional regulator [Rubrobacter sp.]|nr:LysR family transcriptional regulator [Rubrobacter sp.]